MNISAFSKCSFLFLLFCFSVGYTNSQNLIEKELKSLFIKPDTVKNKFKEPLIKAVNEIDIVFSTGFFFYKSFISSQDKPSCIFSPSCSEFAVEAFQKEGVFLGWLKTFDRLSRCHAFAKPTHYHFNTEKNIFYDPVH